ncbi:MAG TPA: hypothetical protein VI542_07350 [Candidatus Tectomicrobia bacterium]
MTSHELARMLLAGADLEACLQSDEFGFHFVVTGCVVTTAEGMGKENPPSGVRVGQEIVEIH